MDNPQYFAATLDHVFGALEHRDDVSEECPACNGAGWCYGAHAREDRCCKRCDGEGWMKRGPGGVAP